MVPNFTLMTPILFYAKKTTNLLFFLFIPFSITAQQNLDKAHIAASGYDVVSYFSNKAVMGNETLRVQHNGAIYLFNSKENEKAFVENPEKYIPQYGGWCAYAMGDSGKKVSINPTSFSVEDGKLYLFYKTRFVNTKKRWKGNTKSLKARADKNWESITNKPIQ